MRAAYKAGIGALVALGVGWGVLPWLSPLGALPGNTQAMLATTREILRETEALQEELEQVRTNLGELGRQDQLLAEQEALMDEILEELAEQEDLAAGARGRMIALLEAERKTAGLTRQASQAGAATMKTLSANAAELGGLAAATQRIHSGSSAIDGKLNGMLGAMESAADNFVVIGDLKRAVARAQERNRSFWEGVWEWFKW